MAKILKIDNNNEIDNNNKIDNNNEIDNKNEIDNNNKIDNNEMDNNNEIDNNKRKINKGTGAGGSNTNLHGKKFEMETNNYETLLNNGYARHILNDKAKYGFYLEKIFDNKKIIYIEQSGLKIYFKNKYNIDLFRYPDEAYIIEFLDGRKIVKILEKKEQNVNGSVETKLWSGPSIKREYELVLGKDFEVEYAFCLNKFLKEKYLSNEQKYKILKIILEENKITVLYGDDENYFENLDKFINSF